MTYLTVNGKALPLPDQYRVTLTDVEAKSSGETEGGTYQRDIVRLGRVKLEVSFTLTRETNARFSTLLNQAKLRCSYLDPKSNALRSTDMMMSDYQAIMVKNTHGHGLWRVSFTLTEL